MTDSSTFCIYPWIHMYTEPGGNVYPCCASGHSKPLGNVQHNTVEEVWNSTEYKQLRLDMLNGVRHKDCSTCYAMEDAGITSIRQKKLIEDYPHLIDLKNKTNRDGSLDEVTLRHFDVRWSNICNFKCRTCYSNLSSSIAQEENKNSDQSIPVYRLAGGDSNDKLLEQFKPYLTDIETFYFAGGEPLITDKHYDILEYLIEIGHTDCELQYNTNFSTLQYKDKSLFDLWKQFSNISIRASFDAVGKRAEYIREGTDWTVIEQNMQRLEDDVPHIRFNTCTVVSILNIGSLIEFIDYMLDTKYYTQETFYPQFYNLQNPHYYGADAIDPDTKKYFLNYLHESLHKYAPQIQAELQRVIAWIESSHYDPELKKLFKEETAKKDAIRQRNILDYIPELENYMNSK